MNPIQANDSETKEKQDLQADEQVSPREMSPRPYIPERRNGRESFKDNSRIVLIGVGIAVVLLLFALGHIPHNSRPEMQKAVSRAEATDNSASLGSVTPILEAVAASSEEPGSERIGPEEIARTASIKKENTPITSLGDIRPFDNPGSWEPAPFRPNPQQLGDLPENKNLAGEKVETRAEGGLLDRASVLFMRNATKETNDLSALARATVEDPQIGLPEGTRLRARLEAAVSTAVPTPVVAIVEYNYERNGEIVVPAGSRAVGRLEAADRSGYVALRFNSLLLPDGSTTKLDATAVDLNFRPLKGRVQGKNTGKNVIVRSLAGVGEIAATIAGRGSLNQSLSEGDLLRERLSNNIGQASDEQIARLSVTERPVVSITAGTHIYVVLQKTTKALGEQSSSFASETPKPKQLQVEELRQLLQLQRELNQDAATAGPLH